jgi:hypothetical protein
MLTRRRFLALVGAAGATGAAAYAGVQLLPGDSKPTGDPVIKYGKDSCARCHMVISDERFAAAWREPSGNEKHFDDIGCMVFLQEERNPGAGTKFWVRDYLADGWLDAGIAAYAISPSISSPMAYGVAATTTDEGARRIVKDATGLKLARWTDLGSSLVKRG